MVFNRRAIPNQLTVLRLVLAGVFFVVLNQYRYLPAGAALGRGFLLAAFVFFIIAALTDFLDGYLARRWRAESMFGRIMDPFCDKVLVLGAFIYLSGPRFVDPLAVERNDYFTMISGVYPWMVAVILARELLVTGIRDEMESQGVKFGAQMPGKLKAVLQLIVIPVVLFIVWCDPRAQGHEWMCWLRDGLVYATVAATVLSGIPYLTSAWRAVR
jgi:CDP-diacylglycerol--glycerol-3-phosphate 3-phosphatidyltransferase